MRRPFQIAAFLAVLVSSAGTATLASNHGIVLTNGQNCFDNKCLRYDARRNTVSIQGRVPVAAGDVSGNLSREAFSALFYRALRARERSSGRG